MAERWGDDSDEEPEMNKNKQIFAGGGSDEIPPTQKSHVDSKGIQVVTSYRRDIGNQKQLFKTTTKVRVSKGEIREPKSVEGRRTWAKFGKAMEDGGSSTIISKDDVYLEDPNADTNLQDDDDAKNMNVNLTDFWTKTKKRELERKYDVNGGDEGDKPAATPGKYVPPSARDGMEEGPERRIDDLNTIRVTNISENTTEADLQELFKPFGRISRVYLAKDKETLRSRGFAFVSFVNKDDAARAMDQLQGYGYDHLILKLEWARPNTPKDHPASGGNDFRSGYGMALAQDTKEKVSYASNLTK